MGYRLMIWKITELEAEDLAARTVPETVAEEVIPAIPRVVEEIVPVDLEVQVIPEVVEEIVQVDLEVQVIPEVVEEIVLVDLEVQVTVVVQAVRVMVVIKHPV
jgi:hypothetical protein